MNSAPVVEEVARTVLVPLDGSIHATAALAVAEGLAELEAATIHLVHVAPRAIPSEELLRRLKLDPAQLTGRVLSQMVGTPAAGIIRKARERKSILIVMCAHTGLTAGAEPPLGEVAAEVLRSAPCPVVLVQPNRGDRAWKLHRLLIPHDGSPTTAAAIRATSEIARRAGAELDVIYVAAVGPCPADEAGTFCMQRYLDQPQHEFPVWTREFLDRLRALSGITGSALQLFFARGDIGLEIMELAARRRSDLIAIAWRGALESARGRVFQSLVRDAPSPVIVFRAGE